MWWLIFGLIITMFVLVKGADLVVKSFGEAVSLLKLKGIFLAMVVVALSTSLPELFVGVVASIQGVPQLSWGNVLGSNVANVSLVIGLVAVLTGSIAVVGDFVEEELLLALGTGALPVMLLADGKVTRVEGLLLLIVYGWYLRKMAVSGEVKRKLLTGQRGWLVRVKQAGWKKLEQPVVTMLVGILCLTIGAEVLVKLVEQLAIIMDLSVMVVGMLAALGTVVPELVLSFEAIKKREVGLVLGNLLGSIVTNATLVLGLTAFISPVNLDFGLNYGFGVAGFAMVFGLFWLFTKTKKRLDRWEGLVLVGVYFMFVGWQLMSGDRF
jgi:cation:H+ antiporter